MKTLLLLSLAFLLNVAGSAQTGLEKKTLSSFKQLVINGASTVYLNQSTDESISASSDYLASSDYSVKEDVLTIDGNSEKIYINFIELISIQIKGNADVYSSDTIKSANIRISSTGAADANLLLKCTRVEVEVTGSGDVKLAGETQSLKAEVTGAGDLKAYGLIAEYGEIAISGASDAQVNVKNILKGDVTGAGTLYHSGDPKQIEVTVSGAGEVKRSNSLSSDTTRIMFGRKQIIILDKNGEKRVDIGDDVKGGDEPGKKKSRGPQSIWSGFELGVNGWMNTDNTFNLDTVNSAWALNYGKSVAVNINFWELHGKIYRNNIYLTTGLGSEINNYRFDQNVQLIKDTVPVTAKIENDINYDKSKLTIGYLNAPLYLTFASNPIGKKDKRLTVSPGITAGWRFTSYNKRKVEENGENIKSRTKDDFNLSPFRVNASLRVGYGSFILFANYSLTDLFQKNEGPDLTAFSAGVRIVGLGND